MYHHLLLWTLQNAHYSIKWCVKWCTKVIVAVQKKNKYLQKGNFTGEGKTEIKFGPFWLVHMHKSKNLQKWRYMVFWTVTIYMLGLGCTQASHWPTV